METNANSPSHKSDDEDPLDLDLNNIDPFITIIIQL